MIRFIDLRNQGTYFRFAFWDTGVNKFLKFDGNEAWDDYKSLREDVMYHHLNPLNDGKDKSRPYLKRLRGLMPEWAIVDDGRGEEEWEK